MYTKIFKQQKLIWFFLSLLAILIILFQIFIKSPATPAFASSATPNNSQVRLIRTLHPSEWGVPHPAGLSFVARPAINIAFDEADEHLFLLDNQQKEIAQVAVDENGIPDPNSMTQFNINALGINNAAGMDVDRVNKHLLILDSGSKEIVRVDIHNAFSLINKIDLSVLGVDLRGIAVHPENQHLFISNPVDEILYELTEEGQLVHIYDLENLGLIDPSGLSFGQSSDLTDGSGSIHLFIADSNLPNMNKMLGTVVEVALDPVVRFAVIGDFGAGNSDEAGVAALVDSWSPDFVITTGDNNYPDGEMATMDDHVGQYYSQFIGNYQGEYGSGSSINRFWPSLGNHDWHSISCDGDNCNGAHFDYFTLPNNERYYDVDLGLVHLFALDSDSREPDGRNSNSIQADWFQNKTSASSSCFKMVYLHHPPYSTGWHGSNESLQWPFIDWGADAVFGGHDHMYERLDVEGKPFFVNGAGGAGLYDFDDPNDLPSGVSSMVRYNDDHGAMLVTATLTGITYQFYNKAGALIDDYTVAKDCEAVTPTTLSFNPTADAYVDEAYPDTNFGTTTNLDSDLQPDEESFIRFNVTGVEGTIESATLRLFATNRSSNGPALYGIDNSWSETEVNWNNRPLPITGIINNIDVMESGEWVELDVTSYVNTEGVYNFALLAESFDGVAFSSREGDDMPELVLTIIPEPTPTPTATPPSPTPVYTTLNFGPTADMYVAEAAPDDTFGTSTDLKIDKSPDEASYIRFAVSGVSAPVQNATLRLYATNSSENGPKVYGTDNSWLEAETTWNNRPLPTTGVIADVAAMDAGTWVEYDVTTIVNSDGTYNFVLQPDSVDGATFSAREGNAPAQLLLTLNSNSTPTPTATASSTPTPTATPSTSNLTFAPSADAFARESDPESNFGASARLDIDKSPDEESFIRFDVAGTTGTVQNATLRLFVTNGSSDGPGVFGTDNNWSETEINWNNRPSPTTGLLADVESISSEMWVEYDVTAVVNGDGIYSFVFLPDSINGVAYSSREGSVPAELVVTFNSDPNATPTATPLPPTPSTLYLTFIASSDAFVRETAPDDNFGLSARLDIDQSPEEESYVRFAVSDVTGTIQNAVLRMFVSNGSSNGPGVYGTRSSWNETEITWNNRPSPTTGAIDDVVAIQSGNWVEYDVTSFIDGDGTYNFVFLPDSTNGVAYSTKEGGNPSELILTILSP